MTPMQYENGLIDLGELDLDARSAEAVTWHAPVAGRSESQRRVRLEDMHVTARGIHPLVASRIGLLVLYRCEHGSLPVRLAQRAPSGLGQMHGACLPSVPNRAACVIGTFVLCCARSGGEYSPWTNAVGRGGKHAADDCSVRTGLWFV